MRLTRDDVEGLGCLAAIVFCAALLLRFFWDLAGAFVALLARMR